ncbi:MAG: ATP-binding cassette domain-containing protein [Acidobacteriaceae bacterium]|nr:ATP-binding cassette domain-containing protein [Acidobacteriaceae bacterium]
MAGRVRAAELRTGTAGERCLNEKANHRLSLDARLVKRFPAIRDSQPFDLDIHLRAGRGITVLLGPSGAGKTVTLNCLAGFTSPDQGRILVEDQLYFDASARLHIPPQLRRCGYIFQDHALFPHMTVRENIRFAAAAARSRANRGRSLHRRVAELLEAFELGDLAARTPAQLSGGQKQRAAPARILAGEPRLILMDEPTRGLDTRLRQAFYAILRDTRERLDIPVVVVTHDLEECFELADHICLIEKGRFLQVGPRDAVLARPASVDAARFLGFYAVAPAQIKALDPGGDTSRIALANGDIEGPYLRGHLIGDRGFVCVRETEITIHAPDAHPSPNCLLVKAVSATPCARGMRLQFEGGLSATVNEAKYDRLRGHDRVLLEVPSRAVSFVAASASATVA